MALSALILSAVVDVRASSITATSCNQADVQTALNSASAGDTVIIPAGNCAWTSGIYWAAPPDVIVRGAGNLATPGGGDATVIVDNSLSGSPLLTINTNASGKFRLAGITFKGGSGAIKETGLVAITGFSKLMRVDHIHINMQTYTVANAGKPMVFSAWLNGVLDHSIFDASSLGHIQVQHSFYGTAQENNGDESFAAPTGFGTSDFVFMEDNQYSSNFYGGIMTDCNGGGRMVVRYNSTSSAAPGQTHPTGGAVGGRGCRAHELYGNVAAPAVGEQPAFSFSWMSSGVSLVWGNTSVGASKQFIHLDSMRKNKDTYPETAAPNGWGYCGTEYNGVGSPWDGNTNAVTGYPCLDQPGQGQSDLLKGGMFPNRINTTTGTISWPHQKLEPIYEWSNTFVAVPGWGNDGSVPVIGAAPGTRIVENRDVYVYTTSFTGATGTGSGTLAARPATCTAGVAYWATDSGGNWNTVNGTPNDGALYKCTATNTWALYYTPYTYPHPLTQGSTSSPSVPPSTPTNLRLIPGSF
jgi:hypothetical protein